MKKILHIEDDEIFQMMLARRVQRRNLLCDLIQRQTAEEGLVLLDDPVDLILLDLGLPRMSGLEMLEHLKQQSTTATSFPLVWVFSGSVARSDREKCEVLGATKFYNKDSDYDAILADLDHFCGWQEAQ